MSDHDRKTRPVSNDTWNCGWCNTNNPNTSTTCHICGR